MSLDPSARAAWEAMYPHLTTGQPGKAGAATRRGAPVVRRLSMLYALLDQASAIGPAHLEAASAVWRYSVASARLIFGATQFTALAGKFLSALDAAGATGLDRVQLRKESGSNNFPAAAILAALEELRKAGFARVTHEHGQGKTSGRPREVWRHVRHALANPSTPNR